MMTEAERIALTRGLPHDLGGSPLASGDFTAVQPDEAVFEQDWHGRTLALTIAAAAHGKWNLDASRHARECLPPDEYRAFSYYEKWLSALTNLLVAHALVKEDELRAGQAPAPQPLAATTLTAGAVDRVLKQGASTRRDSDRQPLFAVGQRVRTKTPRRTARVGGGHTRLPAYASGAPGVIAAYHGVHVLPDSNAHFLGEAAEPLYGVMLRAQDVFPGAVDGDEICVDLWESYLAAAP